MVAKFRSKTFSSDLEFKGKTLQIYKTGVFMETSVLMYYSKFDRDHFYVCNSKIV